MSGAPPTNATATEAKTSTEASTSTELTRAEMERRWRAAKAESEKWYYKLNRDKMRAKRRARYGQEKAYIKAGRQALAAKNPQGPNAPAEKQ